MWGQIVFAIVVLGWVTKLCVLLSFVLTQPVLQSLILDRVRGFLENLRRRGILFDFFQDWEVLEKGLQVVENLVNLLYSSAEVFRIYIISVCRHKSN